MWRRHPLVVADLEREQAVRDERGARLRDEAAVDREAVGSAKRAAAGSWSRPGDAGWRRSPGRRRVETIASKRTLLFDKALQVLRLRLSLNRERLRSG